MAGFTSLSAMASAMSHTCTYIHTTHKSDVRKPDPSLTHNDVYALIKPDVYVLTSNAPWRAKRTMEGRIPCSVTQRTLRMCFWNDVFEM